MTRQKSTILGAFLFSIGLFSIIALKLDLYTGKVGYLFEDANNFLSILIILFGNSIGAALAGVFLRVTIPLQKIIEIDLTSFLNSKLNIDLIQVLFLSMFCGMLIYIAVESQKNENQIFRLFGIIISVMVFILCGFEHSIADIFYFSFIGVFKPTFISIVIIGNAIGAIFLNEILRFSKN